LVQNLAMTIAPQQDLSDGVASTFNLGSTVTTQAISLSGIGPGAFHIHTIATTSGMLDWDVVIDLNLEKKNTPPVLTINSDDLDGTYATWSSDQYSFSLTGNAFDPDGEITSLSASMCGETTTSFTSEGSNWAVSLSIAKCVADGLTVYDVNITATDNNDEPTSVEISVPSPFVQNNGDATDTTQSEEEAGLPSVGIIATLISIIGAATVLRKQRA